MKKPGRPVSVEWLDICGVSDWMTLKEASTVEPITMLTLGWIVRDTPDTLVVASTVSPDNHLGSVHAIPKGCIQRIKTIKL